VQPNSLPDLALKFMAFGAMGWALENTVLDKLFGPSPKSSWPTPVRVLNPVYGSGGVLVSLLSPHLAGLSLPVKAVTYGAVLTGLEFAASKAERAMGKTSWAYGNEGTSIDLGHSVAWAILGIAAEQGMKSVSLLPAKGGR